MKSYRALNRDLKYIAGRIIKADAEGRDADPADLQALKETVELLIAILKAKP